MPTLLRRSAALLVAAGLLILSFGALAPAGAAPLPPLVFDYAAYPDTPQALLTVGCDFAGLTGVSFTALGVTASTLAGLPALTAGDTVRFAWTDVTPACVGSAVSLVVKDSPAPFFDLNALQPVAPDGYSVTTATAGPGFVELVLPPLVQQGHACAYQLDAIVGVPLAQVGLLPNGSFYSESLRNDGRRTTLVSARNGAYDTCTADTTTTTSTTQPTTSTTGATTTTGPVTSTTGPGSSTPPSSTPVSTRTLAATGRTQVPVVALGMALVLLGAGALFVQRLRRTR